MSLLPSVLVAQLIGAVIAAAAARLLPTHFFDAPLAWALLQGGAAATVAYKLGAPPWWAPIHALFLPLALLALRADIPPSFWFGAFLLLLLLFWRTGKDRVPLYLSNRRTADQVVSLLPKEPCKVLDLGCGTGSLLAHLARERPDIDCIGVEHAPLPFVLARWRARRQPNLSIRYGDFWKQDLSSFRFVYVFLSPQPMPALWKKACTEMPPSSRLVSNSFAVPGAVPAQQIEVPDRRRTQLFCYELAPAQRVSC